MPCSDSHAGHGGGSLTLQRGCDRPQDFIVIAEELEARVRASGRTEPVPTLSAKQLKKQAQEEARKVWHGMKMSGGRGVLWAYH
jgi:hypothetical protein